MSRKLLMNNSSGGLMPVQDGLICWLDGRDGKNGDIVWKDRSGNGNDAILMNMLEGELYGFNGNCVVCSKNGGYIKLPECFYRNTNHSFFVFGETFSPANYDYQRLFTLSKVGNNSESIRFEIGSYIATISYSININQNTILYTPNRDEVIGIGNQYVAYSFDVNLNKIAIKYNEDNIVYRENIPKPTVTGSQYCYLNNESESVKFPRDVKYKTVLLYNRALTDSEIQQNFDYEQSIQRG